VSRGTTLAAEALAGLASTEDYSAINLKKPMASPVQYPDTMLLRMKGRRHVETRLVEPVPSSVNSGDCYILVQRNMAAQYFGELSNVVEKARAKEVSCRHCSFQTVYVDVEIAQIPIGQFELSRYLHKPSKTAP